MILATNNKSTHLTEPLPVKIHMDESHARLVMNELRVVNANTYPLYPHLSILLAHLEGVLK